jgi:hypothetical protein
MCWKRKLHQSAHDRADRLYWGSVPMPKTHRGPRWALAVSTSCAAPEPPTTQIATILLLEAPKGTRSQEKVLSMSTFMMGRSRGMALRATAHVTVIQLHQIL